MSSDQAADLLPAELPSVTSTVTAAISLENLVEGKRTGGRGGRTGTPSASTPKGTPSSSTRSRATPKESTSQSKGSASKGAWKRKFSEIEPKATSTPTPKRKQLAVKELQSDVTMAPSPLESVFDSPQAARKSPRKAKAGLFSNVKGPIPKGTRLFIGFAVIMSYVDKPEDQRKKERKLIQLAQSGIDVSTDESGSESALEEENIPFDKEHIKAQIEGGGGVVLDKFVLRLIEAAEQPLMVSDSFQRTVKYFHCLAASVPCVSHVWVRDCCRQNKLLDFKSYLLPSGLNILTNKLVEWQARGSAIRNMSVMVSSGDKDSRFKEMWTAILETAGCVVVQKVADSEEQCDLVVSDSKPEAGVIRKATTQNVPIVSVEWVIQCLITGRRVEYTAHPKFKYDYKGP